MPTPEDCGVTPEIKARLREAGYVIVPVSEAEQAFSPKSEHEPDDFSDSLEPLVAKRFP